MRHARPLFAPVAALALAAAAGAQCPDNYTHTIIADSADEFATFDRKPAIAASGHVTFVGELDTGGEGIFLGAGLQDPVPLVLDEVADPMSEFVAFGEPTVNGDLQVAFWAQKQPNGQTGTPYGIYRVNSAFPPDEIALERAADPASEFQSLGLDPDIHLNGAVLFSATLWPSFAQAIVRSSSPGVRTILSRSDVGSYGSQSRPNAAAGPGWWACSAVDNASFELAILRNGDLIAQSSTANGTQVGDRPVVSDGGAVAYSYAYPVGPPPQPLAEQVRITRTAGQFDVVVDSEVDPLRNFSDVSIGISNCVVFRAFDEVDGVRKVYVGDENDGVRTALAIGQQILGGTVWDFEISSHAVNGRGQIAAWVLLGVQGGSRELIVRADPNGAGVTFFDDSFETGDFSRWSDFVDGQAGDRAGPAAAP